MKVSKMNDAYHRDAAEKYEADENEDCAICGNPVRWPLEPVAWDKNNHICHAECVEKEKQWNKQN